MGMISEGLAHLEAERLEKILDEAIKIRDEYNDPHGNAIVDFCRDFIYPLYCSAIGEAFGSYKEPEYIKVCYDSE